MIKIKYEQTWCEYLTPCPFKKDIFVGEWECNQCPNCIEDNHKDKIVTCSY